MMQITENEINQYNGIKNIILKMKKWDLETKKNYKYEKVEKNITNILKESVKEKLISDYKILVAEITEEQLYETISSNDLVDIKDLKNEDENISSTTKKIAHQILLFQAIENFKIRKIVSFHSNVQRAKDFIYSEKEIDNLSLEDIFKNSSIKKDLINYKFTNLNAKDHTSEERNIILDETFNNNELGVISNAKCLTEGIDVPIIPGLKPISTLKQINLLPHRFHCDLPEELIKALIKCKDNSEARQVGIEWCIKQSKELMDAGLPFLHYYSMGRSSNIRAVAEAIF